MKEEERKIYTGKEGRTGQDKQEEGRRYTDRERGEEKRKG